MHRWQVHHSLGRSGIPPSGGGRGRKSSNEHHRINRFQASRGRGKPPNRPPGGPRIALGSHSGDGNRWRASICPRVMPGQRLILWCRRIWKGLRHLLQFLVGVLQQLIAWALIQGASGFPNG